MAKKSSTKSTNKTTTLTHQHAKPYRKHHLGLLVFFSIAFLVLLVTAVQYRTLVTSGVRDSLQFVSDLFNGESKSYDLKLSSSYGFNLQYNQKEYYASAIDTVTGDLLIGSDLSSTRPYGVVRVAKSDILSEFSSGAVTITYHSDKNYDVNKLPTADNLNDLALDDSKIVKSSFDKSQSAQVTLGGKAFTKTTWTLKPQSGVLAGISSKYDTYVGLLNNKPITIVVSYGLSADSKNEPFKEILDSISFSNQTAFINKPNPELANKINTSRTLLDSIFAGNVASAASESNLTGEKLSALNSPAVVKIYNFYCKDVVASKAGEPVLGFNGVCTASTGSGFFLSQDGYIATNGHVAVSSPKELTISNAVTQYLLGRPEYINILLTMTSLKQSALEGKNKSEQLGIVIDAVYGIEDSSFSEENSVNNLFVLLDNKVPDVRAILEYTKKGKDFPESDNLKKAEVVSYNYRLYDNYPPGVGFKGSDVALLKISGSNYPVVQLGSIDNVGSGSTMYILGFPVNATNGQITDTTESIVTLTKGTVSSIKNASGSTNKLIETDTLIGHGNSGGPAFSESGKVIGISTYVSFGELDATYNYVRDIADLKDLITKKSISLDTNSKTQAEWSKGIDNFYTSHYSKALDSFNKAKSYYAYTTNVDKFIKESKDNIAAGKDVQDFPLMWVIIAAFVTILGIGATVFLIIKQRKKHDLYNVNVASGNIQPLKPGSAPQQVPVNSVPVASPQNTNTPAASSPAPKPPAPSTATSNNPQPIDYFGKKN